MNYSELLQLAKGWGNFVSDRINIWRLRQIESLKQYVEVENILTDKASGKNVYRPAYQALKGVLGLREGDVLYCT